MISPASTRCVPELLRPSPRILALFGLYLEWYMRRHFHAVRLAHVARFPSSSRPLILYLNHPSWWDPLAAMLLSRRLAPDAEHYAPMDETALEHYGFFRRMGLFAVEPDSVRGAAQFLRKATQVLESGGILWITPQGHFSDARTRPVVFKPGLAALLTRFSRVTLLPVAIEYTFWDERLPEVLANCGEPIHIADGRVEAAATWNNLLAYAMTAAQEELAALAASRDAAQFESVLSGHAGISGIYEAWHRFRAPLRGVRYQGEHGSLRRR